MGTKKYIYSSIFLILSVTVFGQSSMKKVNKIPLPKSKSNSVTSFTGKNDLIDKAGKNLKSFMNSHGLKSTPVARTNQTLNMFSNKSLDINDTKFDVEKISWDYKFGTPRFIKMSPGSKSKKKNQVTRAEQLTAANQFLNEKKDLFKIDNPSKEFELKSYQVDKLNKTHVKYQQVYEGLKVWGHELIVHLDMYGNVESITGRIMPSPLDEINFSGSVNKTMGIEIATRDLKNKEGIIPINEKLKKMMEYEGPTAEKIIWYDENEIAYLVWHVQIRSGLMHNWQYFVSAETGNILDVYDNVCLIGPAVGTGYDLKGEQKSFGTYEVDGTYYLMDASQQMFNPEKSVIPESPLGVIATYSWQAQGDAAYSYITSEDNVWTDSSAVSAHKNIIDTYEYLYNVLGRNSYDDNGATIRSFVHYTEHGQNVDNASWNGRFLVFGDGATSFSPLAEAIDAAAHELAHGVVSFSANLLYQNQSGALNESFADVVGALLDSTDWQIGEEVVLPGVYPNNAMRDMSDPHNGAEPGERGWQPENMSEFVHTTLDKGGVHTNSGIPNKAFYFAAEDLGRQKAGRIWYRALNNYLVQLSQFIDARLATIQSAEDLFGENSPEVQAVKDAWDGVELYDGPGTPPPPTSTLEGEEHILFTNTKEQDFNTLYMADTVTIPALHALSATEVFNKPAVSDTSGLVLFIDGENNLRALIADPSDPQEEVIDTSGIWSSVAVGPGLSSIAMTTIYIDTSIYYFNLNSEEAEVFKVMNSTSEDVGLQTALYADALSFDPTGTYILMDSYNEIKNQEGDKISFWTLNILALNNGLSKNVFPPEEGYNLGNPSFSKMTTTRFVFDVWNDESEENRVFAFDIQNKNKGVISPPDSHLGYPSYSPNDKKVIYSRGSNLLFKVPLEDDLVTGIPYDSEIYHEGGTYPIWFVVGSRVTSVDENEDELVKEYSLLQNYPNPFNPSTKIEYSIPERSQVSLKIYDILGREVALLVNTEKPVGTYEVNFDAENLSSGIYFYTLKTDNYVETKKMLLLK